MATATVSVWIDSIYPVYGIDPVFALEDKVELTEEEIQQIEEAWEVWEEAQQLLRDKVYAKKRSRETAEEEERIRRSNRSTAKES